LDRATRRAWLIAVMSPRRFGRLSQRPAGRGGTPVPRRVAALLADVRAEKGCNLSTDQHVHAAWERLLVAVRGSFADDGLPPVPDSLRQSPRRQVPHADRRCVGQLPEPGRRMRR
jgi:hypothetical protein